MLIPITKKYIIKHTFGNIDDPFYNSREEFIEKYTHTIYPYPEQVSPISMYWGHIQSPFPNMKENILEAELHDDNDDDTLEKDPDLITYNNPRPGIILEENVYYFIWDGVSWVVPSFIYNQLDENHIIVGDFSYDIFINNTPTNAKVVEIIVDENGNTNILDIINNHNLVLEMSDNISNLLDSLQIGYAGYLEPQRYAILSIMDEIAHRHNMFGDMINNIDKKEIYDRIGLNIINGCYDVFEFVALGLRNIVWELLDDYGYTDYGTSLDHAWLNDDGWDVLGALRWESLSAKTGDNIKYAFDGTIEKYNDDKE